MLKGFFFSFNVKTNCEFNVKTLKNYLRFFTLFGFTLNVFTLIVFTLNIFMLNIFTLNYLR
jgi:hypothetical protein